MRSTRWSAALDRCVAAHGQALVVSNGEPRPVADLFDSICAAAGVPGPQRRVPAGLAYAAGAGGRGDLGGPGPAAGAGG